MAIQSVTFLVASMAMLGISPLALAHEGHDHGAPPPPVSTSIAPRFDASSDTHELVGIYRGGTLTLHLDRFIGNEPISTADIDVETPIGTRKAKSLGNGLYLLDAPWADKPGAVDLIATISINTDLDVLTGTLTILETDPRKAKTGARDLAQRLADGSVFVPKASQKILGLRNILAVAGHHPRIVSLPGRIIPDPDASGVVQTSVAGRLSPPPGGFLRLGARVKAGDVLAITQPSISAADLTAHAQQARELDQQIALVTRRLERFRQISGAVTRSQVEDAELELAGLMARRVSVNTFPKEPERLVAPVDGIIAAMNVIHGQIAEPGAVLFQIADPERLWIEGMSYSSAFRTGGVASAQSVEGKTLQLKFQGVGFADRNQAVPVHFSISGGMEGLRLGQRVTILAENGETRSGIAIPRTSVIKAANGQAIVFEQTNAERFVPREVRVQPLDGARVLVLSGIETGKRIVTDGAELLNQIR